MFKKEAEEYIKEHTFFDEEYGVQGLDVVSKTIFQDGAELGYNKANEWHDLRKAPKDLPKLKKGEFFKTVLIYTKQYCHDWYDTASYSDGTFFINGVDVRENVIAWREVPKFQKESK